MRDYWLQAPLHYRSVAGVGGVSVREMNKLPTHTTVVLVAIFIASLGCSKRQPTSLAHPEGPCPGQNDFVPVNIIAEMTHYEVPVYPRLAYQAGLEGTVWIKGLIGSGGSVLDALLYRTSGTPALDESALQAAYRCEFKPAYMNGQSVCMWVHWRVEFILSDSSRAELPHRLGIAPTQRQLLCSAAPH